MAHSRTGRLLALIIVVVCASRSAMAQTVDERLTVSGAAGIALPFHADFDFNPPEWQIAIRATVSRHFLLEGFFNQWRERTEDVRTNLTLHGPSGVTGHVSRLEHRTTYAMKTVGVNWLARGFIGRAAFTA